jgi:hypothetical protein
MSQTTSAERPARVLVVERLLCLTEVLANIVLRAWHEIDGDIEGRHPPRTARPVAPASRAPAHRGMNGSAEPVPEAVLPIDVSQIDPRKKYAAKFASDALDCSIAKIRKDIAAGKMEAMREGARVFILGAELIKHMEAIHRSPSTHN